ncbi:DUF6382 domain-containing protein [Paenibacillus humicola]|uniref:DUF6382 domain-containing protein n=1 Tax=Paenibacillus humicola TaxID=3110540 RepID=UPI00237B310D|nr:DUF6382 domain-containing protein [Paenibacillus humicola]
MNADSMRIDFALNREHEMVVDRETGIRREELDEVEIQMLQSGPIPKLLDIGWIEIDGRVTFRYPLKGKRMLTHRLQAQPIAMADFYTLLLSVVEALDDSRHYMLQTDGFLLDEHTIFVGERWDDIGLVYVPLRAKGTPAASAREAVQQMAVRWIGCVEQPDGKGLQLVLQHLRDNSGSWNGLRQSLLSLIGGMSPARSAGITPVAKPAPLTPGSFAGRDRGLEFQAPLAEPNFVIAARQSEDRLRSPEESLLERNRQHPAWNTGHQPDTPFNGEESGMKSDRLYEFGAENEASASAVQNGLSGEEEEEPAGRSKLIVPAGLIAALAVIWRFLYLASPTKTSLMLSSSLSLMAVAGAIYFGRRARNTSGSAVKAARTDADWSGSDSFVPDSANLERKHASPKRGLSMPYGDPDAMDILASGYADPDAPSAGGHSVEVYQTPTAAPAFASPYPNRPEEEGGRLAAGRFAGFQPQPRDSAGRDPDSPASTWMPERLNSDSTVLLGDGGASIKSAGEGGFCLEREWNGQVTRLPLESNRFIIGRSDNGADFVDDVHGISRTHVELAAEADQTSWSIKDTGSRNGSTINGTAMIPYKSYPLQDGDVFQLAGDSGPQYRFRSGNYIGSGLKV